MAGHSLGGVAASQYLADQAEDSYEGLILCASYTTTDFSSRTDFRLLSMYGSEDQVLNKEEYENSKSFWPEDSQEYVIQGGNHAGFGSYGKQSGDGKATITNIEQIKEAAEVIENFIDG